MSAARPAKPPCARCGRVIGSGWAHWPEGYLCSTCRTHALETYGPCAGCGAGRLTPGIAPDGGRLCTGCAGGLGDFTCETCGREGIRYRRGACGNCVLAELLAVLLDDGTGRIRPELVPLAGAFCQMKRPRGGITWIRRPHVREMLRTLADPGTADCPRDAQRHVAVAVGGPPARPAHAARRPAARRPDPDAVRALAG